MECVKGQRGKVTKNSKQSNLNHQKDLLYVYISISFNSMGHRQDVLCGINREMIHTLLTHSLILKQFHMQY